VADRQNYHVQKFSSNGTSLTQWERAGRATVNSQTCLHSAWTQTRNFDLRAGWNSDPGVYEQSDYLTAHHFIVNRRIQTILAGATATLRVKAFGSSPLTYQWQLNGTNITDATAATLTLTNVMAADGGPYAAIVSNNVGSVLSSDGLLTVVPAIITNQPASRTVLGGSTVALAVGVARLFR